MSHPLPEPADLLRLTRLLHELCEIGGNTLRWREHLQIEMEKLADAQISVSYLFRLSLDPTDIAPKALVYLERGLNEVWQRYIAAGDLSRDPVTPHIMRRFGTGFTVLRRELVDDSTWFASDYFKEVADPSGLGDTIYSQVIVKDPAVMDGFSLARSRGMPDFTQRELGLVRFIHQELARLWNREDPIGTHTLPPRQREVLDGIRRGEARKAIAERMGVSDSTVHTYEKALFDRAGVSSRGEMLARLAGVIRPNLLP